MPDIYDFADYIWLKRSQTVAWISANYSSDVRRRTRLMPFIVSANAARSSTTSSPVITAIYRPAAAARTGTCSVRTHAHTHGRRLLSLASTAAFWSIRIISQTFALARSHLAHIRGWIDTMIAHNPTHSRLQTQIDRPTTWVV